MPVSPDSISALEAARRNMNAAIRMLFSGEDPLVIHLVVAAVFRVLHDLAEKSGEVPLHHGIESFLLPGAESVFSRALNEAANVMKDAARDPSAVLQEFKEERNDFEIAISCVYLECLDNKPSPEAQAFLWWFATMYPHVMRSELFFKASLAKEDFGWLREASRAKQLQVGHTVLKLVQRNILTAGHD